MEIPFQAYRGSEAYVFVCYAHSNADVVYSEITGLHNEGIRICYDEGISPGELFTEELATLIEGASLFLYFVTPASVASRNCLNEVQFATSRDMRVVAVHLEETTLPKGLELSIGLAQAILKYQLSAADYQRKLHATLGQPLAEIQVDDAVQPTGKTRRFRLVGALLPRRTRR